MNFQEKNEGKGTYQLKEIKDPSHKCNMWVLFGSISNQPNGKTNKQKSQHVLYDERSSDTVWMFDDIRDTTFFCVWGG